MLEGIYNLKGIKEILQVLFPQKLLGNCQLKKFTRFDSS